tara:strand:- start:537 stop:740 length:204 start_codon:yes stop_codon:yes gene_type:complete
MARIRKQHERELASLQARKLTSSQANEPKASSLPPKAQASSQNSEEPVSLNQGTSKPSPYPGNKQQE